MGVQDPDLAVHRAPRGCGPFAPVPGAGGSLRLSIFERIRAEGVVARATIAKDLRVSPATVTTQTATLIEMGFVREEPLSDPAESGRGRPPIGLSISPKAHIVAGLKLSDQEHTAVIYDFSGAQLASATLPAAAPSADVAGVASSTETLVRDVCTAAGVSVADLSAIGVGVPGFINRRRGIVHWSPLFDEATVSFAALLTQRLGRNVIVENDANLVALAELWFGVGRQISNFAVITIEHGVGMGLVIDHKLYCGARGIGMELGHTKVAIDGALCRCGQRGCLEAYVADYALVREAAFAYSAVDANAPPQEILHTLYQDAKAGNATARSIFERAGKYLSMGMGNVANLFDPELIILSGGRMQYDYLYSDEILEEMNRHALNSGVALPPVEIHAWGDLVWASGAAAMALSHVTEAHLAE